MASIPSAILFDDVIDFLASAPTPEQISAFEPSESLKQRLAYLLEQNRHDVLSSKERSGLDEFLRMNHFMNMLKLRARAKLGQYRVAERNAMAVLGRYLPRGEKLCFVRRSKKLPRTTARELPPTTPQTTTLKY